MSSTLLFVMILSAASAHAEPLHSRLVYPGNEGRLVYVPDSLGNTIPDFSHAGYRAGGVDLPSLPVRATVQPGEGDDGAAIQRAIDAVANRPPDASGFRGAVLLLKGRYQVEGTLRITRGGVVLRGEGKGGDGTVIEATGKEKRSVIRIVPEDADGAQYEVAGTRREIRDAYVPLGSRTFRVADAGSFEVGDEIIVHRPSTEKWIAALGMDRIPPRRNGGRVRQWRAGSYDIRYHRIVTRVSGDTLAVDVPLFHALDRDYGVSHVYKTGPEPYIQHVGVENMSGVSSFTGPKDQDEEHAWTFVEFDYVRNGWVRDVTSRHFGYACVSSRNDTKWITVRDCASYDPVSRISGSRRYSFSMRGELHLVENAFAEKGRHDYAVGTRTSSGTVFLDCVSDGIHASNEPHHRYSTGILYDNVRHTNSSTPMVLGLWNRGNHGSGHGWAAANSVLWNCEALDAGIACEKPPLAQNYAIGVRSAWMTGDYRFGPNPGRSPVLDPRGAHWEHWNVGPVEPRSLYRAQLRDRLGE